MKLPSGNTTYAPLRTKEQEDADHSRHNVIKTLPSPIAYGSEKQITWAKSIFETERFYWFAQGYAIADLQLFLNSDAVRSAKWWIDNRPTAKGFGKTRIAMEAAIAILKKPCPTEERFRKLVKRL